MIKNIILLGLFTCILGNIINAQVIDRAWAKDELNKLPEQDQINGNVANRKYIPYPFLREADILWSKRVWRTIDLREKINLAFYYPEVPVRDRKSLSCVLLDAVIKGDPNIISAVNRSVEDTFAGRSYMYGKTATAFKTEELKDYYTCKEALELVRNIDTTWIDDDLDPFTPEIPIIDTNWFKSSMVKEIYIIEDWYFDKHRGSMEARIISIAPVREIVKRNLNGVDSIVGKKTICWFYFPEIRPILANHEMYNTHNNAERKSYDDVFMKRFFGSYITKVENVYDRYMDEYLIGLDALLEAERVKRHIFTIEHDTWEW